MNEVKHTDRASSRLRASGPPDELEGGLATASYRTKQLVILATDVVVAEMSIHDGDADALADQLVRQRVLPGCYRTNYDEAFLWVFASALELTRNLLVSDAPFVPNTVGELAARAIFTTARTILTARGVGWEGQADELNPGLRQQLSANSAYLSDELESLRDATLEDDDLLGLFQVPEGDDPSDHLSPRLRSQERALLRFENWLVPFGNAPRPYVTYDGRAWPLPF